MENKTPDRWKSATLQAAEKARHLHPWALYLCILVGLSTVWEGILEPTLGGLESWKAGAYPNAWEFAKALSLELTWVAPKIALLYACWYVQRYLLGMSRGKLWSQGTAELIGRLGEVLIAYALLQSVIIPNIVAWAQRQGGLELSFGTSALVGLGLGMLLRFIAGLLRDMIATAQSLKQETESFI